MIISGILKEKDADENNAFVIHYNPAPDIVPDEVFILYPTDNATGQLSRIKVGQYVEVTFFLHGIVENFGRNTRYWTQMECTNIKAITDPRTRK